MNPPKCDDLDHIHFLIAAQKVFTCTEAAKALILRDAIRAYLAQPTDELIPTA